MGKLKKLLIGYALYEVAAWSCIYFYLKKHKVLEVEGINVYKIPKIITNQFMHISIAGATQAIKPFIVVDDDFDAIAKYDSKVANFILAHELGHIRLGHIKANMKILLKGKKPKRNINYEIEADTYAVSTFTHIKPYDGIKFVNMVKGIEEERIDNLYILYEARK